MSEHEGGDFRFFSGFLIGFVVGVLVCLGRAAPSCWSARSSNAR
jgi:hypothetical protein